ncbi:MAG: hypothetical protein ACFFDK_07410 [Promethearchaeota archaeon]
MVLLTLLKYFEQIYWIGIVNRTDLTFHIRVSKKEHREDYDFI